MVFNPVGKEKDERIAIAGSKKIGSHPVDDCIAADRIERLIFKQAFKFGLRPRMFARIVFFARREAQYRAKQQQVCGFRQFFFHNLNLPCCPVIGKTTDNGVCCRA